jgi:glutathione S-transferase
VTTLRWLTVPKTGLVDDYPNLAAYVARAEARPAFQRAFAAQRAVFEAAAGHDTARKG